MAKTDTFQLTTPAWVVNERLIYHSQNGRMLDGLKYDKEGRMKVDGYDDMPALQPLSLAHTEEISPGQISGQGSRANTPIAPTVVLTFRLYCARRDFFFRRTPESGGKKGLLEWVALVCDAIETTTDGLDEPDSRLLNTLEKPVSFSTLENDTPSQLAFETFLEVTLPTRHYCRGERSATFPEELG